MIVVQRSMQSIDVPSFQTTAMIQSKTFVSCSGSIIKVKKVKTYEIFRPFFNRTSSVNDMNVEKMNFKKGFLTPLGG